MRAHARGSAPGPRAAAAPAAPAAGAAAFPVRPRRRVFLVSSGSSPSASASSRASSPAERGPVAGLERHPALEHVRRRLRRPRPCVAQIGRALGRDPVRDLHRVAALARLLPAERLERDRGQRVDVRRRPRLATVELLRRHVRRGAEHRAAARDPRAVRGGRNAEVGELRHAVLADQDVSGLDVAMHHSLRVRVVERLAEVEHHPPDLLRPHRAAPEHTRQRLAVHVLHDDQHALVVGGGVEHRDEVRVVQRCAELRLAGEALLDVGRAVGVQALDGNLAAETLVLAEEDGGHAAGAEVPDYPITAVKK